MIKTAEIMIGLVMLSTFAAAADSPLIIDTEKKRLVSGSALEQQDAMTRLKSGGGQSSKALIDIMEHADSAAKIRAAGVLGSILEDAKNRTPETFDALDELTSDKDLSAVDSAMLVLTKAKGETRAHSIIKRLAVTHENETIRAKAASDLLVVSNSDPANIPVLRDLLKDKSAFVRLRAAGSLGVLGNVEGLSYCLDILGRSPEREETRALQMEAAISAGRIGDVRALPALRVIAQSDSYGPAKGRALIAIHMIGKRVLKSDAEKIAYLKSALKDRAVARWAGYELQNMSTQEAISALKEIAGDQTDQDAAAEAAEVLARINTAQK